MSKSPETDSEAWLQEGACLGLDPETFFPSDTRGVEVAKEICRQCVVRKECLEYALENRIDHGVWGGESRRERARILKQRRANT